jgi:hypothetical protein
MVTNCYSTCDVTGNDYVGGVVGTNSTGATLNYCYATGDVIGRFQVGGISNNSNGTFQNCVALNLNVKGSYGLGRVSSLSGGLSNNYARDTMLLTLGINPPATVTSSDATSTNGADFAIGSSLSTVFNTTNGWGSAWSIPGGTLIVGGALPTLNGMQGSQNPTLP